MSGVNKGKAVCKTQSIGNSLLIIVPSDYVKANGIEKGDQLTAYWNGDRLSYRPVTDEEIEKGTEA